MTEHRHTTVTDPIAETRGIRAVGLHRPDGSIEVILIPKQDGVEHATALSSSLLETRFLRAVQQAVPAEILPDVQAWIGMYRAEIVPGGASGAQPISPELRRRWGLDG